MPSFKGVYGGNNYLAGHILENIVTKLQNIRREE